ncbi:MAG TPA: hypothetical protein VK989_16915, partial [Polyangia bacterium]|nr:hypothetical protein [Polyangia bacterium]
EALELEAIVAGAPGAGRAARVRAQGRIEDALFDREVDGDEVGDLGEEPPLVARALGVGEGGEELIDLAVLAAQKIRGAVVV